MCQEKEASANVPVLRLAYVHNIFAIFIGYGIVVGRDTVLQLDSR
jgi:hypothetical protein